MGQKITGCCACGAIRYEAEADPIVMVNCHCRDCQRAVGTAYAAVMVVPAAAVKLRGEPRYFRTVGEAGKWVDRGFCTTCGSPVTAKLERFPDAIGVQAASSRRSQAIQAGHGSIHRQRAALGSHPRGYAEDAERLFELRRLPTRRQSLCNMTFFTIG